MENKLIEVSEEFINHARKLAKYIDSSDLEYECFKRHIYEGHSAKSHIYYVAAVVGGWDDSIQEIIDDVNKEIE